MWTVGCNGGREFELLNSFSGRKLRPFIPRHGPSVSSTSSANTPSFSRIHGHDFFGQLHHFTNANEERKREVNNSPQVVVSSRWNPTPEQQRSLEELYRRGTRTPSAEQIHKITLQLRRYGKVEGKNVFNWFQNHKARERQKRRRQMESSLHYHPPDVQILQRKYTDASRTVYEEDEHTKNGKHSMICSALAEDIKGSIFAEWRTHGRIQFDQGELRQRKASADRHSRLQTMQISSRPLSLPSPLINSSRRRSLATARKVDQDFIKTDDFNIFVAPPCREKGLQQTNLMSDEGRSHENSDQSETLQLFPLCRGDDNDSVRQHQFFEFLPSKN